MDWYVYIDLALGPVYIKTTGPYLNPWAVHISRYGPVKEQLYINKVPKGVFIIFYFCDVNYSFTGETSFLNTINNRFDVLFLLIVDHLICM